MRIAFIVAAPITAKAFLMSHMSELLLDNEVTLICNFDQKSIDFFKRECPTLILRKVKISRKINIISDIRSLISLISILHRYSYDLTHTITPKAGLLGNLSSKLVGVKYRIHTFTGQVWCNDKGLKRLILKNTDRLMSKCATSVLVDSNSQQEYLIEQKVLTRGRSHVLCNGSISGVDVERFSYNHEARLAIRTKLKIDSETFVYLFLGRVNRSKGVPELVDAFNELNKKKLAKIALLIVGPDEDDLDEIFNSKDIYRVGYTESPEQYFSASDLFCLPSHREGFGSVIIEAASVGIASVASNIYGISDAIVDNVTGLLHESQNYIDLGDKMEKLLSNPRLRHTLAENSKARAVKQFSTTRLSLELVSYYKNITNND
jgi:glycosyltransferase involved in cell wall biosynthesis